MSKHTPKPWEIDGQTIYGSGKNPFICHWSGTIFDAYLIAAAPELLKITEKTLKEIKLHREHHWGSFGKNLIPELEKTIKKAKGEEI